MEMKPQIDRRRRVKGDPTTEPSSCSSMQQQEHDATADAATLNSDAAVVADGMGGTASHRNQSPLPPAAAGGRGCPPQHCQRTAGTIHSSDSPNAAPHGDPNGRGAGGPHQQQPHLSSASLVNSSAGFMSSSGVGAENSIVSFGLNFNFDGASSPSNSDSGGKGGLDGSSGEDDNGGGMPDTGGGMMIGSGHGHGHGRRARTVKPVIKHKTAGDARTKAASATGAGKKKHGCSRAVKFGPNCTTGANAATASANAAKAKAKAAAANAKATTVAPATAPGEEGSSGSTSSGSDSGNNDSSGGSAFGGSNNSGGKSTVSSLTTSSNQEWMAANERAAERARQEPQPRAGGEGGARAGDPAGGGGPGSGRGKGGTGASR